MADCVRISECRLCDSRDLDLIISFTPTPPGDQYLKEPKEQTCYPLDLLICRGCGAVQLADTVDPALIYTDYLYSTNISPGLSVHFDTYAGEVIKRIQPKPGGYILDIGSNDGTLLRAFKNRGFEVLGIDPAAAIARHATKEGLPTFCSYFTNAAAKDVLSNRGAAAIITANHIMANVADLHDFAEGIKNILASDGTFVFETGYWPAIRSKRLIDTIEHEHIHYFAVAPLARFFDQHGLRLVHAEEQPTKGGALRGFVKNASAQHVADDTIDWMSRDPSTGALHEWTSQLETLRCEIQALISRKKRHEPWVGYGAAVGSTLLLHHFGLGRVLEELWDDNASRHGLYSPGFHLPVVAPNHSRPDRIVCLAWRYADRILAYHPEHAHKWILPLPALRYA